MTKKTSFIILNLVLILIWGAAAKAHFEDVSEFKAEYAYKLLNVSEPSWLPDSPFYFIKNWGRRIRVFFAFSDSGKAEIELEQADAKLAEIAKLAIEKPDKKKALERALKNYLYSHQRLEILLSSLKENDKNIDSILEKLAEKTFDHESLFMVLKDKIGDEGSQKMKEGVAKTVKSALGSNKEKTREKFEKRIKKYADDDFEDLEIIDELEIANKDLAKDLSEIKYGMRESLIRTQNKTSEAMINAKNNVAEIAKKIAGTPESEIKNSAVTAMREATKKISEAEAALNDGKYGRAYGLANAAEKLTINEMKNLGILTGNDKEDKDAKDTEADENGKRSDIKEFEWREKLDEAWSKIISAEKKIAQYSPSAKVKTAAEKLILDAKKHWGFTSDSFKKDDYDGVKLHLGHVEGFLADFDKLGLSRTGDVKKTCIVTGCSSQVCSDKEVITTCEWKAGYACFRNAKCEVQPNGECGWTKTAEYEACLNQMITAGKQSATTSPPDQFYGF